MVKIVQGHRIGQQGRLSLACSAVMFDSARQRILLTRRQDDGRWCLPGGRMEPGEDVAEACAREVWEETGLRVHVGKLIGVYSNPHRLLEYPDGARYQVIGLCFEAVPSGGVLTPSDETTEFGYFTLADIAALDVHDHHRERISDAWADAAKAFVR